MKLFYVFLITAILAIAAFVIFLQLALDSIIL